MAVRDELHELVSDHGLVAALGINNPFHFVLRQVKVWLQDEVFGRPITYQVAYGNYLPNWHPWEKYLDFYDESQIMGVIAQELGTLYTLLDTRVCELYAQSRHSSALESEGPDNVQVLAHTTEGTAVTMQVDLLQDFQQYDYRIVGEFGVIEASLVPHPYARRYLNSTKSLKSSTHHRVINLSKVISMSFAASLRHWIREKSGIIPWVMAFRYCAVSRR